MDEFEFRPLTEAEMPALRRLVAYVFGHPEPEPEAAVEDGGSLRPEWTHGAFHRGRLVASSGGFPLEVRLNGRAAPAEGVTAVGTDPGFRRRGLMRRLVGDLLRRARRNGQCVSILWASLGALYQRLGYGLASAQVDYRFDPRFAELQFGRRAEGYSRRHGKDDALPTLRALYDEFIEPRNLLLHRPPWLWQRTLRNKRGPRCAIHYNAAHEPDGYLLYTLAPLGQPDAETPLDQALTINELVWRDMNGYRGLWAFIRAHDLVGRVVTAYAAEDDPAPALLLEPRILHRATGDGIWLRVVDAAAALGARGYDHAGETTIAIGADDDCPWNVGVVRLRTDGRQTEATRQGNCEAEVTISPQGLASLLTGYASLSQLTRVGRAQVADQRRLPALDALFASRYRPHCLNHF